MSLHQNTILSNKLNPYGCLIYRTLDLYRSAVKPMLHVRLQTFGYIWMYKYTDTLHIITIMQGDNLLKNLKPRFGRSETRAYKKIYKGASLISFIYTINSDNSSNPHFIPIDLICRSYLLYSLLISYRPEICVTYSLLNNLSDKVS